MATASVTAAVSGNTITAVFWNNTINAILNQLNGNIDEDNIIDGAITASKLAVGSVDLSTSKVTGNIPVARFNSGTNAGSTTFWRGDGTWAGIAPSIAGAFKNLVVTRSSATAVAITADELVVQTSGGSGNKISSVSVSAAITTSGANGLDTGAEAANTIYYVYVIRKSSDGTVAALLSTSASSPTLPSGYDQKALVSVVGNDNSSNFIAFSQAGIFYWLTATISMASGNVGTGAWVAIDLTPATLSFFVPSALSTLAFGILNNASSNAAVSNDSGAATGTTLGANKILSGSASNNSLYWEMKVLTADTLYWMADAAGASIHLGGFILDKLV